MILKNCDPIPTQAYIRLLQTCNTSVCSSYIDIIEKPYDESLDAMLACFSSEGEYIPEKVKSLSETLHSSELITVISEFITQNETELLGIPFIHVSSISPLPLSRNQPNPLLNPLPNPAPKTQSPAVIRTLRSSPPVPSE